MSDDDDDGEDMETGEVNRQGRPGARGSFGEAPPITADQLASAIANAQSVLGMAPPPPSPGNFLIRVFLKKPSNSILIRSMNYLLQLKKL